jgi:hypothetical protein
MEGKDWAAVKGHILKILQVVHPEARDIMVIRQALRTMGKPIYTKDLLSCIDYLEYGGYVEVLRNDDTVLYVKLINKGLNLLDKYITDPGVLVE